MTIDPTLATVGILLFLGCIGVVAAVFLPGIAKSANALAKENLKDVEYDRLQKIVNSVCRYVEQKAKLVDWSSEQKQAQAASLIKRVASKFGLEVDDELLAILIEAAVQIINTEVLPAFGVEECIIDEN